ncbi:MAG: alpha/beta fold hydrolase [Promethearchaeota archaeon]
MTLVKIRDTELFYTEFGIKIPFLVMHGGLGFDHSYFRPFLDPLENIFKLIFYDHRGHGRSGRPPINTITYEQLADDANELREKLGYNRVGIMGHSAGGYVALEYAIRYPQNISYLILLDTAPAFDYLEEVMINVKNKNPPAEIIATLNAPVASSKEGFRDQFKILIPLYFYDFNSGIREMVYKMIDRVIMNHEMAALNDELMPKFNVSSQLSEILAPTLILVGKDDFICPVSQAKRMNDNIPNSNLHVFKNCGHFPFIESSKEFLKVIHEWFKNVHH